MLHLKGGILSNVQILLRGNENAIKCSGRLYNSKIIVEGNNNTVVIGSDTYVSSFNILIKGCNCKVVVGDKVTSNGTNIKCFGIENEVVIGNDCMLSRQIEIWNSDSHYVLDAWTGQPINKSKPVRIGNHVWIGQHATILKGVTIGNNSIVGMNTVVTKNIPQNCVCVGNPGKVRKNGVTWDRRQTLDF